MSPVEQVGGPFEESEVWIAGVDPVATWVSIELVDSTSYEVLVVRDEHNSEIGAVLVLDREQRGRRWNAAQFNMRDFQPALRDGDPEALAVAAVERLREEEECTCGSVRLLEQMFDERMYEWRDILTGAIPCPPSATFPGYAQSLRDAATAIGIAVASPRLARWFVRELYAGGDGWQQSDEAIVSEVDGRSNDQHVLRYLRAWYRFASAIERLLIETEEGNLIPRAAVEQLRVQWPNEPMPHRHECPLSVATSPIPEPDAEVEGEPKIPSESSGVVLDDGEAEECWQAIQPPGRSVWDLILNDDARDARKS